MQRLLGLHALGRVALVGLVLLALGLEVGDEALERVLAAVEHEVVGELALLLGDLRVRRDVVRVDHRQVEPGLDAVVQEHASSARARRRRDAERHVGHAERRLDAGISALIARIPSIVSTALGRHSSSPVVSVKVRQSKISASGSRPCSSQHSSVIRRATSSLRSAVLAIPTSSIVSAISAAPWAARAARPVELVAPGLEVDRVDDRSARDLLERGLDHVGLGRVDLDRGRLASARSA